MKCKDGGACGWVRWCEDCPHKKTGKPLDRGKASFLLSQIREECEELSPEIRGFALALMDKLIKEINSGRLDVEEG